MRLSLIFLVVLTASVLVTSLAAWGIIYGTSYSRVTTMSSEFTILAHEVLDEFGGYVTEMLQSNSILVNSILTQQKASGETGIQQIKNDMITTIGTLVNYTTNTTVQSQAQMNEVVDTFAALMGKVVGNFRNLTNGYTAQLRAGMASNIAGILQNVVSVRVSSMQQYPVLQQLGVLNLSRTPWDPIGSDDCKFLGALCASNVQMGDSNFDNLTLVLATGRSYFCSPWAASISFRTPNGTLYNEDLATWMFSNISLQSPIYERCLSESPDVVQRVGQSCSPSQSCQCGDDQRCTPWYRYRLSVPTPSVLHSNITLGPTGAPSSSFSLPLLNTSAPVPQVLAVLNGADNQGGGVDIFLNSLGVSPTTTLGIFTSDAQFSVVGTLSRKCAANETAPGDPSLPLFSALRVCDPGLLWVTKYIAANRLTMPPWATLLNDGVVWDIFSVEGLISYYIVIGTPLSEINAAVDTTNEQATTELSDVRVQQLGKVAASGVATRAYVAAVGAQNVAVTQAMEVSFLAQIESLDNASRVAVAASQNRSTTHVQQLTTEQMTNIDALTSKHLDAMSATAGWTIAVMCGILLGVLLASAWGTIRITLSLTNIIALMEDVADMKVENLEVPQNSGVQEVARIQTAFQVLISRLAEYKSYIPAGLFEQRERRMSKREGDSTTGGSDEESASARGTVYLASPQAPAGRSPAAGPRLRRISGSSTSTTRTVAVPPSAKAARRNVVVLCVKATGFTELLGHANEGLAKSIFNDYVTIVHEAISSARGNIDSIVGDQTFATFNAHIPCGDSAVAAVNAALEVRNKFIPKLGDRLKFQIGISFGPAFANSVGYAKFKSMVTVGSPMKVAVMLSQLPQFESGTILLDHTTQERVKFLYKLVPVELVHMPNVKSFLKTTPKSQPVFAIFGKKNLDEDEWMYQIHETEEEGKTAGMDWVRTFQELAVAKSVPEGEGLLEKYLAANPLDDVALRLPPRLSALLRRRRRPPFCGPCIGTCGLPSGATDALFRGRLLKGTLAFHRSHTHCGCLGVSQLHVKPLAPRLYGSPWHSVYSFRTVDQLPPASIGWPRGASTSNKAATSLPRVVCWRLSVPCVALHFPPPTLFAKLTAPSALS